MPELPEMENYRTLLQQKIVGHTITDVQINRPKSINTSIDHFVEHVRFQKVMAIKRRGKHLLFYLDNEHILLLHLMLGGWLYYSLEEDKPLRTVQVQFTFTSMNLYFIGLRLGYLHLYPNGETVGQKLAQLGPEPLAPEFGLEDFLKLVEHKRGRLKTVLVDQKFIAGIGNCYSDEICFQAGLLPTRYIQDLSEKEAIRLYHSIQQVLKAATRYGGYMEHPLFKFDTLTGGFDDRCQIYDREGEPCVRCGAPIKKELLASRKMFFCMQCQR